MIKAICKPWPKKRTIINLIICILLLLTSSEQLFSINYNNAIVGFNLKFHPIMLANPDKPYIQGNFEIMFRNDIGLEIGFGKRYLDEWFYRPVDQDSEAVRFNGTSFLIEVSKHKNILFSPSNLEDYIGGSFRMINDLRNVRLVYYRPTIYPFLPIPETETENCAIKREIILIAFRYGVKTTLKNGMIFETFFELGAKYKNQYHIGDEMEDSGYSLWSDSVVLAPVEFKGFLTHFMWGFRVGYRIF